jgi:HD-GYP domain-containing protein (c-di-GMP phosphodiesterase class II)
VSTPVPLTATPGTSRYHQEVPFELIVRSGANAGQIIPLILGKTITLGRLKTCDIQVDELSVSRRHCTVLTRENGCLVVDLQAANGTFVNDRRVETSHLEPGDTLRVGSIVLELAVARRARPAPTPLPEVDSTPDEEIAPDAESAPDDATLKLTPDERGKTLVRRAIDPNNPEFLTRALSGTISHARLESAHSYLMTLHKVSDMLSRVASVEALFDAVLRAVLDAIKGDRAAILLRDPRTASLDPGVQIAAVHSRSGAPASSTMTLSRTIVRDVLDHGMSAFTHDALADQRYLSGDSVVRQQIRSVMCAPMRTSESILGVVYVDSQSAHEFTEQELELLAAIGNQAGIAVHRARLLEDVERLSVDVVRAIAAMIDAKDGYTHRHSERVAAIGVQLARQLGMTAHERRIVELSSLLHDVGKIGIPDAILKKPGRLSDAEYAEVCKHPEQGVAMLAGIQNTRIADLLPGIKSHHERWDGSGYPEGLRGDSIPLLARIVAVADVFDAISSHRTYREALTIEESVELIRQQSGRGFDPRVVGALLSLHEQGELGLPTSPSPITF